METGDAPDHFCCPIGLDIMRDPVVLVQTGHTFERKNIEEHLAISSRAPLTGVELTNKSLVPNYALRTAIETYLAGQSADTSSALTLQPQAGFDPPPPGQSADTSSALQPQAVNNIIIGFDPPPPPRPAWNMPEHPPEKGAAEMGPKELTFSHVHTDAFDQKGVLYAIGSNFGKEPYSNPADKGRVALTWSADAANFYSTQGGHKTGDARQAASVICGNTHPGHNATMWSQGAPNAWFALNLGAVSVMPTHFAYRNDYGGGGNHPKTFVLQGSQDGAAWSDLSTHSGESWNGKGAKQWPISGGNTFYSHFRILNQGAPNHLCCSGIELYGLVNQDPGPQHPPPAPAPAPVENTRQNEAAEARAKAKAKADAAIEDSMQILLSFAPEQDSGGAERKFVAHEFIMGESKVSAAGLKAALGLSEKALAAAVEDPISAIRAEFLQSGSKEDQANFKYVACGTACETDAYPKHMKEQIRTGKYHGGPLEDPEHDIDLGHDNMVLQDFCSQREAKVAKLTLPEVLCIRLYTTSSFPCFNRPLRNKERPHPFALAVYFLTEGLKKLRAVEATMHPEEYMQSKTLYRGMKDMVLNEDDFLARGGTEMAPMSTSADIRVAAKYAASAAPMLFEYRTRAHTRGVDISPFSVYPKEKEFLYPPLTLIIPDGEPRRVGHACVYPVVPQMT